jgi:hypothetical protein
MGHTNLKINCSVKIMGIPPTKVPWRDLLSPQGRSDSARCSPLFSQLKAQDAVRPPSTVRRSSVSVRCPNTNTSN